MDHGIFTFADDAKEAYSLMIKYVSHAERAIKKLKVKKIKQIKNFSTKFTAQEIAPIIRGLSSNNKDQKFIVNYRLNKHLKYFMNGKNVRSYSSKGTATPDHVIRVKPFPLIITPKKNSTIEKFNFKKKYDLIIMSHVLEHLFDPLKALKKCSKSQNVGQHILVEVPLFENVEKKTSSKDSGVSRSKYNPSLCILSFFLKLLFYL